MASWVWSSPRGWYCRLDHRWYATREEAVAAVRRQDVLAGIVWSWQAPVK